MPDRVYVGRNGRCVTWSLPPADALRTTTRDAPIVNRWNEIGRHPKFLTPCLFVFNSHIDIIGNASRRLFTLCLAISHQT